MPNINYQRGYRLEYRVKKFLEKTGWTVLRSPSSKGSADLIAFNDKDKLMIQCKTTIKEAMYIYGLKDLIEDAESVKATPILAYSFMRTPVYGTIITDDKAKFKKQEENQKLQSLLENL